MKKWKRILAVAVMLALVFCAGRGSAVLVKSWQNGGLLGVNAVASTTENWGLGFGESGDTANRKCHTGRIAEI